VVLTPTSELEGTKEIDLYVCREDKRLFLETLSKAGWLQRADKSHLPNHHFYSQVLGPDILTLDVKYDLSFIHGKRKYQYINEKLCIKNRELEPSYKLFVPAIRDQFLLFLAHVAYIERGFLENRHVEKLKEYLNVLSSIREKDELKTLVEKISKFCIPKIDLETFSGAIRPTINSFFSFKEQSACSFGRIFFPRKFIYVLFLGTDGSGKSTTIASLCSYMNCKTSCMYMGEKNWALPFVGAFFSNSSSRVCNILYRYFLYPLDLLLRRLVLWKNNPGRRLILIDRFPGFPFFDVEKKGFLGVLLNFIYKLVLPSPEMVVFLHGDAEEISQRQQEESVNFTKRNQDKFLAVAKHIGKKKLVVANTTENSSKEVVDIVAKNIFEDTSFIKNCFRPISFRQYK